MSASNPETHARKRRFWLAFFAGLVVLALFLLINRVILGPTAADEDEAAKAENRVKIVEDLHWANLEKLTTYDWVNREKGTVRIPIERAMELAIPVLNATEPHPAYPVATPVPAPAPEAPANGEPAAAADSAAPAPTATPDAPADDAATPETSPTPATEAPAEGSAPPAASITEYPLRA